MSQEARLASMAFERLDGSGWHRGLSASGNFIEARTLQAAVAAAELSVSAGLAPSQSAVEETTAELKAHAVAGWLDHRVVDVIASVLRGTTESRRTVAHELVALTAREREVLGLVTHGLSNKEIGRDLGIAPKTVSAHLEHVYRKLAVSGRTAATMKALEYGLI